MFPLCALVSAGEGETVAASGDFTNPAQVAFSWWAGIIGDLDLARSLTVDPSAWNDCQFYNWLVSTTRDVYSDTETVGVDLELIVFSSVQNIGNYRPWDQILANSFITRLVGEGEWVIAANARSLPVPGRPPTEQVLPRLLIDGN